MNIYIYLQLNDAFINHYGYTAKDVLDAVNWSGGSFLPWGGDFFAYLLSKESDLLLLLQIFALKYQAIGSIKHSHEIGKVVTRELPSAHVLPIRVKKNGNIQDYTCPSLVQIVCRETLQGTKLIVEVLGRVTPLENETLDTNNFTTEENKTTITSNNNTTTISNDHITNVKLENFDYSFIDKIPDDEQIAEIPDFNDMFGNSNAVSNSNEIEDSQFLQGLLDWV